MTFTPGKAIRFYTETVTSAAGGDRFEATGKPFLATFKYLGAKAVDGKEQIHYLVENTERGEKYEVTRGTLLLEGLHEGSDSDFPDEEIHVLIVSNIDVDPSAINS